MATLLGVSLLTLFASLVTSQVRNTGDYSMCTSDLYRDLPLKSQNEHQCLLLEQFNKEFFNDREDRVRRYKELNNGLENIHFKLDEILMTLDREPGNYGNKKSKEKQSNSVLDNNNCTGSKFKPNVDQRPLYSNCYELQTKGGVRVSGVYPVRLVSGDIVLVLCDMDRGGGGWTTIQRRIDGSVNFTRNWTDYKHGFGNPNQEYWLGLETIHLMTSQSNTSLRVDLWDWNGKRARAEYLIFYVGPESSSYRLLVDGYHGNTGDSLGYHNNCSFSTMDRDNDQWNGSCAKQDGAGWWYKACSYTALNSKYHKKEEMENGDKLDGIFWYHWKETYTYPLPRVEMKIRPWK